MKIPLKMALTAKHQLLHRSYTCGSPKSFPAGDLPMKNFEKHAKRSDLESSNVFNKTKFWFFFLLWEVVLWSSLPFTELLLHGEDRTLCLQNKGRASFCIEDRTELEASDAVGEPLSAKGCSSHALNTVSPHVQIIWNKIRNPPRHLRAHNTKEKLNLQNSQLQPLLTLHRSARFLPNRWSLISLFAHV